MSSKVSRTSIPAIVIALSILSLGTSVISQTTLPPADAPMQSMRDWDIVGESLSDPGVESMVELCLNSGPAYGRIQGIDLGPWRLVDTLFAFGSPMTPVESMRISYVSVAPTPDPADELGYGLGAVDFLLPRVVITDYTAYQLLKIVMTRDPEIVVDLFNRRGAIEFVSARRDHLMPWNPNAYRVSFKVHDPEGRISKIMVTAEHLGGGVFSAPLVQ
ncbi:MAG: hypothetical protein KDC38_20570 [Planctomycetes bacterium]|nr:hypothetical protein [Planctomycetota bacterium]